MYTGDPMLSELSEIGEENKRRNSLEDLRLLGKCPPNDQMRLVGRSGGSMSDP